jgi:hypothetical protein
VFACVGCIGAAQGREFIEVKTPYFTVVSALSEKKTRELIEQVRVFQAMLMSATSVKDLRPQVPLRIYLIKSGDWRKYVAPDKFVDGLMYPRPLSSVAVMNGESWDSATRVLFHEYVHFVLHSRSAKDYPRWFDEGYAELFSTFEISNGKFILGKPAADRISGPARWVPLRNVLEDDWTSSSEKEGEAYLDELGFYAESWALVHYALFELPNGPKALPEYIRLRWKGVKIEEAFSSAFGMSIAKMEDNLEQHLSRSKFKVYKNTVASLSLPQYGSYAVRKMSPAETTLEFGNLVALINPDEFLPYFEQATREKDSNDVARAAKANALALEGNFESAHTTLTGILAANPTDPAILILAGDTYSIEAETKEDATDAERGQLRNIAFDFYDQALIEPYSGSESLETIVHYAEYALQCERNLDRAIMQLGHARKTYPTEPQMAALHARLLMATNRLEEARQAWLVASEFARGRDQITALDELEKVDALLSAK